MGLRPAPAGLKGLVRPRLWLALWGLLNLGLVYGSLAAAPPAPDVKAGDKWEHFAVYLLMCAGAVQIFRRWRPLLAAALYLVVLGGLLEIAQGTLTTDRIMDWRDAVADTVGVGLGLLLATLPGRDALLRIERRLAPRAHARRLPARER